MKTQIGSLVIEGTMKEIVDTFTYLYCFDEIKELINSQETKPLFCNQESAVSQDCIVERRNDKDKILDTFSTIRVIDDWFNGRGNMERWEWNDLKKELKQENKSKEEPKIQFIKNDMISLMRVAKDIKQDKEVIK